MDEIEKQRIDIALSGGGTRAALYSGGALIAVQEAVVAGKVEVGEIHAVSGSALMIARIILASDDREVDDDGEVDLQLIKDEVEAIARHGFAPSPSKAAVASSFLGLGSLIMWSIALRLNGGEVRLFVPYGPALAALVGAAAYQVARRIAPFSLRRGRRRFNGRPSTRQHQWLAADHLNRSSALPTSEVRFVCSSLKDRRLELVDPWHDQPIARGMTRSASLADCAGASAAVPFYSSAVRVGNDLLIDGGVLDNLGAATLVEERGRAVDAAALGKARLIVVDSSVWGDSDVEVWGIPKTALDFLTIFAPALVSIASVLVAQWFGWLGQSVVIDLGLMLLALLGTAASITAFIGNEALELAKALRAETGVRGVIMWSQRAHTLQRLGHLGDAATLVELSAGRPFATAEERKSHDLRTRLSTVRGDTATALLRASYEQTVTALGTDASPTTISWLDELVRELSPRPHHRRGSRLWSRIRRVGSLVLLGWGYDRYWFSVGAESTPDRRDNANPSAAPASGDEVV